MTYRFPADFFWGGSVSAHQTEGATGECYGKGPSVYDVFGEKIGFPTWSIAAGIDTYHRYEEDFDFLKELGMNSYRFSISWSRIFPSGDGEANPEGVAFYHRLIDALIARKIEPMICAYHFDLPFSLQERFGGWISRETVAAFDRYTRFLIDEYGEKVHWWVPMNEQNGCKLAAALLAGYSLSDGDFRQKLEQINHHLNLAAAQMIQYSHQVFPENKIGIMINYCPIYPETAHPSDVLTAQFQDEDTNFSTLDTLIRGIYPSRVQQSWKRMGIPPLLQEGDQEILTQVQPDFIGLSYYSSQLTNRSFKETSFADSLLESFAGKPSLFPSNPYLQQTKSNWTIDPVGLRGGLHKLWSRYQLPLFIMENGIGVEESLSPAGTIEDDYRIAFFKRHLLELEKAMVEDGVHCIGYQTWAPIDILSSRGEMRKRYGFVYVDRDDSSLGTMKRSKKKSFDWFQSFLKEKGGNVSHE